MHDLYAAHTSNVAAKLKTTQPWSSFANDRRWCCVGQNKEPKNTAGINISTTKPDQWLTLDEAMNSVSEPWSKGVVGFVLTDLPSDKLAAIDLDDVLDDEGEGLTLTIKALIADAVEASCYVEKTPSNQGLRIIGKLGGHLGEKWGTVPVDLPGGSGSFELYACPNARYITVTGETIHAPKTLGFVDPVFDQLAPFTNGPSGAVYAKPDAALSGDALAAAQVMATDADRALGASVLATALTRIKSAVPGTRNSTVNNQAFEVAKHIKTGMIDVNEAIAELTAAALECGLPESEIAATLNSAFHGAVKSGETPLLASQAAQLLGGVSIPQEQEAKRRANWFRHGDPLPTAPLWLIPRILPVSGVGFITGPRNCGKSFLGLRMAQALALKESFFDKVPAKAAGSVFVVCEGHRGAQIRLSGLASRSGPLPISFLMHSGGLDSPEALATLGRDLEDEITYRRGHGVDVKLIVIDTLGASGAISADENDNGLASRFMSAMSALGLLLNVVIAVIHHPPKQGSGLRGGGALEGAADFILEIRQEGKKPIREVEMEKKSRRSHRSTRLFST